MLWPGLYRLWRQGQPAGLVAAALQAVLLNTVLVSSFVWTALLPPQFRLVLGCLCGGFWLLGCLDALRAASRQRAAAQLDPQLDYP